MFQIKYMDLITKAEQFVIQLFKDKLSSDYFYHNIDHTLRVVNATKLLILDEQLSEMEQEALLLAAWFHDTGYIESCKMHEVLGVEISEKFFIENNVPQSQIDLITSLIKATAYKYEPQSKLENIIRDADTSHLGSTDFLSITEDLRKELKKVEKKKISKVDWANENLLFLNDNHQYYTDYAKKHWDPIKQENIKKTQEEIALLLSQKAEKEKLDEEKALLNKKKLEKIDSPERGIETMFRVTMNNHTKFSQIADSKANILLSVNAIIISVALSTIVPKLDAPKNAHLIIPTFLLISFSVASIVMAIMSTRPKVSSGTFTRKEIEERKVNLLFFGNFYKMPVDEYTWAMRSMMTDKNHLYDSMIKDLYYLGVVLNRKYKLLRTTYTIFTIGILVSVISFFLAFKDII